MLLSLVPVLRCPRCGKSYHASYLQKGITFPECQKCAGRWWAMSLRPGFVLPQLAHEFEDESIAAQLVQAYDFPQVLQQRHFWQLEMQSRQVHEYREASPLELFRALLLIPKPIGFAL